MVYNGKPPYVNNSDTSQAAAAAIAAKAPTLRAKVYQYLHMHPDGLTDEEIKLGLDMLRQTARARRRELVLEGFVYDSGKRRRTRNGVRAVVWLSRKYPVPPVVQKRSSAAKLEAIRVTLAGSPDDPAGAVEKIKEILS